MNRKNLLISIPAALVWLGAASFLAKWTVHWLNGTFALGSGTSGAVLSVFFLACAAATGLGLYTCIRAWVRTSTTQRQVISLIGACLVLWAVAGN